MQLASMCSLLAMATCHSSMLSLVTLSLAVHQPQIDVETWFKEMSHSRFTLVPPQPRLMQQGNLLANLVHRGGGGGTTLAVVLGGASHTTTRSSRGSNALHDALHLPHFYLQAPLQQPTARSPLIIIVCAHGGVGLILSSCCVGLLLLVPVLQVLLHHLVGL